MKKKIKKFEVPTIIKNEGDAWKEATRATSDKFNSVQIVTSNPRINIDKYRKNFEEIKWKTK